MSDPADNGIPTTNTARLVVNYTGPMGERSLMLRFNSVTTPLTAIGHAENLFTSMVPALAQGVVLTGCDWYPQGSAFSVPLAIDPIAGVNNEEYHPEEYPRFISVTGRDSTGVRVRYTLYGLPDVPRQGDYRLTQAENSALYAFRVALGAIVNAGDLVTVAGNPPSLNPYLNTGFNAYYQRKARRTG